MEFGPECLSLELSMQFSFPRTSVCRFWRLLSINCICKYKHYRRLKHTKSVLWNMKCNIKESRVLKRYLQFIDEFPAGSLQAIIFRASFSTHSITTVIFASNISCKKNKQTPYTLANHRQTNRHFRDQTNAH